MKKVKILPLCAVFALAALIFLCLTGFTSGKKAYAADTLHSFKLEKYDVTFDISSNCSISVTEDMTVYYQGIQSTGFIRDIPVNDGAQVRDVSVKKIVDGKTQSVWYDVYYEENDFLSVDIGDSSYKYKQSERYLLTYTYNITNSVVNNNLLPLNVVGHGWDCPLENVSVKLIIPEGFLNAKCYVGVLYSSIEYKDFTESSSDGKTVITAKFDELDGAGVTFDLSFSEGSIRNYSDNTPYLYSLAGVAVLALMIILKLFVFNKNQLMPVVNYEAPNKMDPLIMGKLIDNKVNSEDITSLIFYWADKNYIKINLDDKNDPTLIRIVQALPDNSPYYEKILYSGLFRNSDIVRPSELRNSYYRVIEQATAVVNKQAHGLYDNKSIGISILFTVLGGLLLGLVPTLIAYTQISRKLFMFAPFISLIPALVIYALAETLMYYRLKFKKGTLIGFSVLLAAGCAFFGLIYVFLIPSSIMSYGQKILLFVISCLIFTCSVLLITRTKKYTDQLNDIIGFKNFITLAEKKQLEMMLEDDPQFYYHILPYAQVLGVTNIWEDKFNGLTVPPPRWLTGNLVTTYIEFRMLNSIMRSSMGKISSGMISRPSSSGSNGGGRGGFGGGFSGGGFGGGGGRGR